jgi:hypothetical protein
LYYYPNNINTGTPFSTATWHSGPTWANHRLLG